MLMRASKRRRLRAAGFTVGDARRFLGLTAADTAIVEIRLALATGLRRRRLAAGLTQTALAKRIGSSQSRVAKMEAGDPTVSLELLIRSLTAVGAARKEIAKLVAA